MNRFMVIRTTLVMGALLVMLGCSGGGDDPALTQTPTPAGSAVGIWEGPSSNGRTVSGAVLEDGAFYFIYSEVGNPAIFRGALVGHAQFGNGSFSVPDDFGQHEGMADFNMDQGSWLWANATGTYHQGQFLNGTMTLKVGGGASFNLAYQSASNDTPDVTQLAGTYRGIPTSQSGSLHDTQPFPMTMVIDSSGQLSFVGLNNGGLFSGPVISATSDMTGTITPRQKGHVYDLVLTIPPGPSTLLKTYRGVAIYDPATTGLSLLAVDPDQRAYFIHRNVKQ